jgi:Rne/Rng family ribonuclease
MNKELIVSSNRHETKVAVLEDEQLVELYFQRANEYSLVGSIHKGRVTRVLPGMQSAFVDIGLERDAFLYVSDFFEESDEYEPITAAEEKPARKDRPQPPPKERAAAPVAPQPAERVQKEDGELRDRKGRRSRRRRPRGRGFPESKYAADVGPRPEAAPAAPAPRPQAEPAGEEFPLLPGESLAKYRRRRPASFSWPAPLEPEEEPSEQEDAAEEAVLEQLLDSGLVEPDEPDTAEEQETAAGDTEEEEPEEFIEPREEMFHEEEAELRASIAEAETEAGEELPGEPEAAAVSGDDEETDQGGEPAESPSAEEVAEQVEENEADNGEEAEEPGDEAPTEEVAESPLSQPATAQVRELEPRYLHRPSRRPRRRGRPDQIEARTPRDASAPVPTPAPKSGEQAAAAHEKAPLPSITDLLKEGQEIIVQIAKEPLGQKGARITSHIALPGRYVVYMPTLDHIGVSRKVASDEERQRLRRILQAHRSGIPGGFIMRTAGEGKREEDIAADMNFLFNLWLDIRKKADKKAAPALLHHDLQVVERVLRDQFTADFKTIWVDNEDAYESILQFLQRFQPNLMSRVRLYTRPEPIFDSFNVTTELEKALRPKVWLKSGGYIVINQTEALVAIDINTGKFVGGKSTRLEDTIVKTNLEAVAEIVRQIRLRDLGGIIVVDFIDMEERKNRQKVMQSLEEAMRADRAPYKILQFNDFGLVAITRKRVKQSLERTLCSPCPYCEGAAYVKSVTTIIGEVLVEAQKLARTLERENVMLRLHPDVAKELKSSKENYLEELEEILGRPVIVTGDPVLHHEKFDLA